MYFSERPINLLRSILEPLSRVRELHLTTQHGGVLDAQCAECQALTDTYQAVVAVADRLAPYLAPEDDDAEP